MFALQGDIYEKALPNASPVRIGQPMGRVHSWHSKKNIERSVFFSYSHL